MKPNIYIRADGSNQIGLGHLVRCTALACMLMDDFEITFFSKEIPNQNKKDIQEKTFGLVEISTEEEFFKKLSSNVIVVLDSYEFDTAYQKKIKKLDCKLVCIDDLYDKEFVADLIINHAPGISPENYRAEPYTKFALGLKFALLRPEFLVSKQEQKVVDKIEKILICFGGADPNDFTKQTIDCLKDNKSFKKIVIIVGGSYTQIESLKSAISKYTHIELHINIKAKTMADIMRKTDLAIVPSSTISLEALASNMLLVTGMTADNQQHIYNGLIKEEMVVGIDNFNQLTCNTLMEKINTISTKTVNYSFNADNNPSNAFKDLFKSLI